MEDKLVKPKMHSFVWIEFSIYGEINFYRQEVVAKGDIFFVHNDTFDSCVCEDFRKPIYYEDYKKVWFKSVKEIREKYKGQKIAKIRDDMYELK